MKAAKTLHKDVEIFSTLLIKKKRNILPAAGRTTSAKKGREKKEGGKPPAKQLAHPCLGGDWRS